MVVGQGRTYQCRTNLKGHGPFLAFLLQNHVIWYKLYQL